MVLNRADFGKFWKSLHTPWNASYILENSFVTASGNVGEDFRWIWKGPKTADFGKSDFEQKAWAIAHGFEHGGFW